jgi:hypothetical protein
LHLLRPYLKKPAGVIAAALEGAEATGGHRGECLLLAIFILLFVFFILTARSYSPLVRLFPYMASGLGLLFACGRLAVIAKSIIKAGSWGNSVSGEAPLFSFFKGYLSWPWTMATLALYVLAIYVFGFLTASVIYIIGVIGAAGGVRKWRIMILAGGLTGLGVWLLAQTVNILLPLGWLTGF